MSAVLPRQNLWFWHNQGLGRLFPNLFRKGGSNCRGCGADDNRNENVLYAEFGCTKCDSSCETKHNNLFLFESINQLG